MWRYLAGAAAGVLLAGGGILLWHGRDSEPLLPSATPALQAAEPAPLDTPPAATVKTREEKRFGRYDKDKDGKVSREEFLAS